MVMSPVGEQMPASAPQTKLCCWPWKVCGCCVFAHGAQFAEHLNSEKNPDKCILEKLEAAPTTLIYFLWFSIVSNFTLNYSIRHEPALMERKQKLALMCSCRNPEVNQSKSLLRCLKTFQTCHFIVPASAILYVSSLSSDSTVSCLSLRITESQSCFSQKRLLRSSSLTVDITPLWPLNHGLKCHVQCFLNTPEDSDSTTSPDSQFQCLSTLSVKNSFPNI